MCAASRPCLEKKPRRATARSSWARREVQLYSPFMFSLQRQVSSAGASPPSLLPRVSSLFSVSLLSPPFSLAFVSPLVLQARSPVHGNADNQSSAQHIDSSACPVVPIKQTTGDPWAKSLHGAAATHSLPSPVSLILPSSDPPSTNASLMPSQRMDDGDFAGRRPVSEP